VVTERGEIWWVDLATPTGSGPGFRRPALVISADAFNASRIGTVTVALLTSNTERSASPGNVAVPREASGLPRDSVVNVTQLVSVDKRLLAEQAGRLPFELLDAVDSGLRLALDLPT
jgi:mRNA interferase MazF